MTKLGLFLLSALSVAAYVHVATADPQREVGKFIIVPAGHTPLTENGNPPTLFSVWRLNTETGALEFCIYDSGGYMLGKSLAPESLKCVPETSKH